MSPSGGTAGEVSFPTYIENFHDNLLTSSSDGNWTNSDVSTVIDALASAHGTGGNPYEGPSAASTTHVEDAIDDWVTTVENEWDNLDTLTDWKNALEQGVQQVITNAVLDDLDPHNNLVSNARSSTDSEVDAAISKAQSAAVSSNISSLVNDFEQRVNSRLDNRKMSISSLYADVNAVHSSGFLISQALLERDAQREVSQFESEQLFEIYRSVLEAHMETYIETFARYLQAEIQNKNSNDQLVAQGTQAMYQTYRQDFQLLLEERGLKQKVATADWEARQGAEEYELSLDEKAALWELDTLERGANIMSGPAGMSSRLPPGSSKASKIAGSALSGAATGAGVGSVVPGLGTAAGAGIGAVVGAGSGLLA